MVTLNDTPRKVKYIARSIVPSSAAKIADGGNTAYIRFTPGQLARFDRQRGNLSRAEYLEELLDMADGIGEVT